MNYQKAHRKKIDALRTELRASRSQTEQLQKQVRQLRSIARVHFPSLLLGAACGLVGQRLWKLFKQHRSKAQTGSNAPQVAETAQATA